MQQAWTAILQTLAREREREFGGQGGGALPDEVQALPFWREVVSGKLAGRLGVPFWSVYRPPKNARCLFIGSGPSFLTDPWTEWNAYFWGLELSASLVKAVRARAPQLNGKLFKGLDQGPPHDLERYSPAAFDLVIATGFSYYLPIEYSELVLGGIARVLAPDGRLLWETAAPDSPWFEDWSIGQVYQGLEVVDVAASDWKARLTRLGAVRREQSGELFRFFLVERGGRS